MEPGNGDSYRYQGGTVDGDISPDFHLCNRGKLSIVLDSRNEAVTQYSARYIAHANSHFWQFTMHSLLRAAHLRCGWQGLEVFKKLLGSADIFLTNFRPGVLESWGCGYDEISQINPDIIFCLISGYGQVSRSELDFAALFYGRSD